MGSVGGAANCEKIKALVLKCEDISWEQVTRVPSGIG